MEPSSADLHPKTGGRFVFERNTDDPPSYRVSAHLAGGTTVEGSLGWDGDGHAELALEGAPAWAREQVYLEPYAPELDADQPA